MQALIPPRTEPYFGEEIVIDEINTIRDLGKLVGNQIRILPGKMKWNTYGMVLKDYHIIALNLYNLGLDHLPESIGTLSHLTELRVRSNRLNELPGTLSNLRQLKVIDLLVNPLQNISLPLKEFLRERENNGCRIDRDLEDLF